MDVQCMHVGSITLSLSLFPGQDPAYDPRADLQPSDEELSEDEEPQQRPVREPQMETVRGKCVVECF